MTNKKGVEQNKNSEADNIVKALKFQPTKEMRQDRNGTWRWKLGTSDEFGNNIGGKFVKGAPSPNPSGRNKLATEVSQFLDECSMDAAELMYTTMMDKSEPIKIRVRCGEEILNRSLGRPKQQVEVASTTPQDAIRPIIISDAVMNAIQNGETGDRDDD